MFDRGTRIPATGHVPRSADPPSKSYSIDAGDVGGELAAALLPSERRTVAPFPGDAAPLVGTYRGPGRGRDMVVQVTQAAQGIAVSVNGGQPRPVPWVEGMTFRVGSNFLTFRGGDLHLSGSSAYTILKRQ